MLTTEWESVEHTRNIKAAHLLHRASRECFDKSMVKVKNSLLRPKDTIAVLWISSNEIGEEIIMEALILWEL